MKNFAKAVERFNRIDSAKGLSRCGWSLWDYKSVGYALEDISKQGYAETINDKARMFLELCGLKIAAQGIGWRITV